MPGEGTYAAFISYSHATDHALGPLLQEGVEKFAKPWYRARRRRVFLDNSVLAAESDLTQAILDGLANADNFLLLASPASAQSRWVAKEVAWWLENRDRRTLFVLLTDGEAVWDNGVLDTGRTTALPEALHDVPEPRCVDLRGVRDIALDPRNPQWESVLADVVAPLDGIEKTELIGHHITERRRTKRTVTAAISVLVVLLAAAVIFAVRSEQQSDRAQRQTLVATSRQLVAQAAAIRDSRPDIARQLLAQAYRMSPTAEVLGALMESPSIPRLVPTPSTAVDVAFSPRENVIAVATKEGIALYEGMSERAKIPLTDATAVRFSPDGELVAATTSGGAVLVAEAADPVRRSVWNAGTTGLSSLAFVPGKPVLTVTGSAARTWLLDVTDPPAPRLITDFAPNSDSLGTTSAVSADGRTIALPGSEDTVELWDITGSPTRKAVLAGHTGDVRILRFASVGDLLASGAQDDTVRLWNTAIPGQYSVLSGASLFVQSLAFAPDGVALAFGDGNGVVHLWDVSDPIRPRTSQPLLGHTDTIHGLSFSADSRTLATAGGNVRLWNVLNAARSAAVTVLPGHSHTLAFGANHQLATGFPTKLYDLTNVTRPREIRTLRTFNVGGSPQLAFSPDGTRIASGLPVALTDPATGDTPVHTDHAASVVFRRDGELIGAAPSPGVFRLWVPDGDRVRAAAELPGSDVTPHGISFGSDDRAVTKGDKGETLQLWDVRDPDAPRLLRSYDTRTDPIESVLFHPTGDVVITGSRTGLITVWDIADGVRPATALRHLGGVRHLALHPDGKRLASAGVSGEVVLWDITDPARPVEVSTLRAGGRYTAAAIAFSPDGTMLGGADGVRTTIWSIDVPQLLSRLCTDSSRIPETEWRQYLPDVPYDPPCA
ncbi:TIR domain-containing protein [Lentzea sp. BCCO 10_0856]|uniref:TIR domain-containing protein n=1 Tax=Lentzea miocenica TaxID=3095431 RepID=A0ABU4TBD6_9PSEU|nr:TIR domain-containing protein [Lentzea sp. BCCO 10_0856]MDX8035473.1 TIR domain-containing protein [Lentzea sp. BCCO 10_0856]